MEKSHKFWGKNHSRSKLIVKILIFSITVSSFFYFVLGYFHQNPETIKQVLFSSTVQKNPVVTPSESSFVLSGIDGINLLYPTKENGRVWYANWGNQNSRTMHSGERDFFDPEFIARGDGSILVDNYGIAHIQGKSPRMYVYDEKKEKKWDNVEVTVYAKRIDESDVTSSQGIVIGARSNHQDATLENPCFGATYYGRLLYDGRAVFQKEVIHEGAYSTNKPTENNKVAWDTPDGGVPRNVWVGVKFIVKNNPDGKSVKLELYRDLTDGENGGTWEKVAEYTDSGDWSQINSGVDVTNVCGYPANKVLLDPGTSVFIRNDKVKEVEYKLFSIREI